MWSNNNNYRPRSIDGQRDSYSTTIKILDENNNVLAVTTMNRNNDVMTIYRNNSYTYTDTATYTDKR